MLFKVGNFKGNIFTGFRCKKESVEENEEFDKTNK